MNHHSISRQSWILITASNSSFLQSSFVPRAGTKTLPQCSKYVFNRSVYNPHFSIWTGKEQPESAHSVLFIFSVSPMSSFNRLSNCLPLLIMILSFWSAAFISLTASEDLTKNRRPYLFSLFCLFCIKFYMSSWPALCHSKATDPPGNCAIRSASS